MTAHVNSFYSKLATIKPGQLVYMEHATAKECLNTSRRVSAKSRYPAGVGLEGAQFTCTSFTAVPHASKMGEVVYLLKVERIK